MKEHINERNIERRGLTRLNLSAPFIYSMFIPLTILFVWTEIYQQIAFRLYGLEIIDGWKYLQDRRKDLSYLSWSERINCWYCQYANGIIAYTREVAIATENMWCPIKNTKGADFDHRENFAEYGSEESLKETLERQELS